MTPEGGGSSSSARETQYHRIKVWDWPVRAVHWSFVLLLPALWLTWNAGEMSLHRWLGYLMLGLVVFRLYWGVAGSSTALFRGFVKSPAAVLTYLRRLMGKDAKPAIGHNPMGGWSVVALLGLLATQVLLGLITQDVDGVVSGPLARYVTYEVADTARYWHGVIFNILLCVIGVHLCAVAFYALVKRDNLVGPMLTGHKSLVEPAASVTRMPVWRLVVGIALGVGTAWWVSLGGPLPV